MPQLGRAPAQINGSHIGLCDSLRPVGFGVALHHATYHVGDVGTLAAGPDTTIGLAWSA